MNYPEFEVKKIQKSRIIWKRIYLLIIPAAINFVYSCIYLFLKATNGLINIKEIFTLPFLFPFFLTFSILFILSEHFVTERYIEEVVE